MEYPSAGDLRIKLRYMRQGDPSYPLDICTDGEIRVTHCGYMHRWNDCTILFGGCCSVFGWFWQTLELFASKLSIAFRKLELIEQLWARRNCTSAVFVGDRQDGGTGLNVLKQQMAAS